MKIAFKILTATIFALATICPCNSQTSKNGDIHQLWIDCRLNNVISFEVFNIAIKGSRQINNFKKKGVITVIDFSKPSSEIRFFVIDLEKKELLFKSFVAHGKNSGANFAKSFSNQAESLKSSLGFFLTAETYVGKHGYSMKLDGLEKGINDNARSREIVIHGADYVSLEFIKKYNRLGRSWGCPALPVEISKKIIDTISNGSCLFIYGVDNYYKIHSKYI